MQRIMKSVVLPLMCLIAGGVGGYLVRMTGEPGPHESSLIVEDRTGREVVSSTTSTTSRSSIQTPSQTANTLDDHASSLDEQMKELLEDYDTKSTQKALSRLSPAEIKDALALVTAMPRSNNRDALRAQLYRAWAVFDPTAAWQAAVADPLDLDRGALTAAVAGMIAKTSPQAAIDLAFKIGGGERRTAVLRSVFWEWSKVDVAAAIAHIQAHPELPMEYTSFSSALTTLAEKDPLRAANAALMLRDALSRGSALSSLMTAWVEKNPKDALKWAESIPNPTTRIEATSSVISAWSKKSPQDALRYALSIQDTALRQDAFQKGWREWFRKDPKPAASFLASNADEKLLKSVGFTIGYYSENLTPKERGEILSLIPDGAAKVDIFRSLTSLQIRKGQFSQALEMLNSMPDSRERDFNLQDLGEKWAAADMKATTEWLNLQEDSSDRDLAVAGFSRTLARTDPAGALEWVKTIPDDKARQGAMRNVAIVWLRSDPARAEEWMATAGFNATDLKMIRDMSRMTSDIIGLPVQIGNRR